MYDTQLENLIIHKASAEDLARLNALTDLMGNAKDIGYFERQFEYQGKGQREVYILQAGGVDAGYCILNWQPKYSLFLKLGIPEIQDLNILPQFRQRGFATHMIKYCENRAREKGCEDMGIGVSVSPAFGPAQRLYTKLGYVADGNGVTYDRKLVAAGEFRPVDDQLCLMLVRSLVKN
jgi:ribosomal protein S18 acetylase RimI-like enzyme